MKPLQFHENSIQFSRFQYRSPNGLIEAIGVVPKTKKKLPVIVFFRGGTRDFGAINQRTIPALMLPLAMQGFAVFGSQYSEGPNSQGRDEYGGKDVADIPALIETIKHGPWKLDWKRLGFFGVSRGALMALRAMQEGLKPKRAAFVSGMFDAQKIKKERPDIYKMWKEEYPFNPDNLTELKKRSPVSFASELPSIPTLFLHSKKDWRTPVRQAKEMAKKLSKSKLVLFEGDDHGLIEYGEKRNQMLIDWFKKM
jgi:dipeptidyl aminopeptidase/acylaminoacyl peptidase